MSTFRSTHIQGLPVEEVLASLTKSATERISGKTALPLAFFGFSALTLFFSGCLAVRLMGLPSLVLLSPFLDWSIWVFSANAFAWVSFVAVRSEARWMVRLGILTMLGTVIEVLPMLLSQQRLFSVTWIGRVLMLGGVVASTIVCATKSREVFSICPATAVRLFLTPFLAVTVPLQVWCIVNASPLPVFPRTYPQVDVYASFERSWQMLLPMTVALFTLLVTEWLWLPLAVKLANAKTRWKASIRLGIPNADEGGPLTLGWRLVTLASLLLSIFVSGYRWSRGYPLGDDSKYYSLILHRMDFDALTAFSTERPFFFLGLYAVEKVLGFELPLLLQLVPIALAAILVVATYCFTRFVTRSEKIAAVAAVFASVSPHVTVGAEYFIVANWFGIPLMMFFLYGFFRSTTSRSIPWTLLTVALSGLTLGIHYFSWLFMILIALAHILLGVAENRGRSWRDEASSILVLLGCIAPVLPALVLIYVMGGGLLASLQLVEHMIGLYLVQATPMNFVNFIMSWDRIYSYFGREHYAVPLLLLLTLIGFARLTASRSVRGRLVKSWLMLSSLGILLVYYNEWWRFLYMIPFEILAAFGLAAIFRRVGLDGDLTVQKKMGRGLHRTAIQLTLFLTVGVLLAFSPLPSLIILLCPLMTALPEFIAPLNEGHAGTAFLLVASLVLEQAARALSVLA